MALDQENMKTSINFQKSKSAYLEKTHENAPTPRTCEMKIFRLPALKFSVLP